jgi:hypothetical protein
MMDSSSVRRALSVMREEISPTRDDKARLRARIIVPAALAPLLTREDAGQKATAQGATPASSLTRWAALKAAGSIGAAAGLTLLAAGGGIGFWLGQEMARERGPSVAAFAAPAPVPAAPVPAPVPTVSDASSAAATESEVARNDVRVAPLPLSEPPRAESRRAEPPPRAHATRARSAPNPLADELALLRRVERALRNNDPALARALLGELDERFPDSRLAEERSAARRIADCRSSEPGASDRARAFLRDHRASVYRQRIVLACALDPEPREKSVDAAPMKNAERADTHVR